MIRMKWNRVTTSFLTVICTPRADAACNMLGHRKREEMRRFESLFEIPKAGSKVSLAVTSGPEPVRRKCNPIQGFGAVDQKRVTGGMPVPRLAARRQQA